jgi:hypothetical protein
MPTPSYAAPASVIQGGRTARVDKLLPHAYAEEAALYPTARGPARRQATGRRHTGEHRAAGHDKTLRGVPGAIAGLAVRHGR